MADQITTTGKSDKEDAKQEAKDEAVRAEAAQTETPGDVTPAPDPAETAALLDQVDGDDKPQDPPDRSEDAKKKAEELKDPPPTAQQTEPPGVIAGETAAMMAPKYVEGVHRHDEAVGWDHAGPILVDSSDDEDTPNDEEKK